MNTAPHDRITQLEQHLQAAQRQIADLNAQNEEHKAEIEILKTEVVTERTRADAANQSLEHANDAIKRLEAIVATLREENKLSQKQVDAMAIAGHQLAEDNERLQKLVDLKGSLHYAATCYIHQLEDTIAALDLM